MRDLGLAPAQVQVWMAALKLGSAGAAAIAREAGVKRPTAYQALDRLREQGLVSATPGSRSRTYAAEDPRRALELHKRQGDALRALLPDLLALRPTSVVSPRIRVYAGIAGVRRIGEELLSVQSGSYRYIAGASDSVGLVGERWLAGYVRRRVARGIRSYSLRIRSREVPLPFLASGERWLREVRFLDRRVLGDLPCLYLYDGTVAVTSTAREGWALTVRSAELFELLSYLFAELWDGAKQR